MELTTEKKVGNTFTTSLHGLDLTSIPLEHIQKDIDKTKEHINLLERQLFEEDPPFRIELRKNEVKNLLKKKRDYLQGLLEVKASKLTQTTKKQLEDLKKEIITKTFSKNLQEALS